MQTVKMRSDQDPDNFLYKKDRCRDHLNSVSPKEGPSDRLYDDIILQCLPPEYDRSRQTHFEREDCNSADSRRMMSKIYADNLARSHSDSSRGIAGRGVAMQAGDGARPQQNKLLLLQQVRPLERLRRLQGIPSPESATQATAAHAARRTPAGQAEAGWAASAGGRGASVVFIPQDHHPQRRRLPRQAGKRAQRQRPLRPSPSSEHSWDLQLVGSPCAR